jgi:hypothetical protein
MDFFMVTWELEDWLEPSSDRFEGSPIGSAEAMSDSAHPENEASNGTKGLLTHYSSKYRLQNFHGILTVQVHNVFEDLLPSSNTVGQPGKSIFEAMATVSVCCDDQNTHVCNLIGLRGCI